MTSWQRPPQYSFKGDHPKTSNGTDPWGFKGGEGIEDQTVDWMTVAYSVATLLLMVANVALLAWIGISASHVNELDTKLVTIQSKLEHLEHLGHIRTAQVDTNSHLKTIAMLQMVEEKQGSADPVAVSNHVGQWITTNIGDTSTSTIVSAKPCNTSSYPYLVALLTSSTITAHPLSPWCGGHENYTIWTPTSAFASDRPQTPMIGYHSETKPTFRPDIASAMNDLYYGATNEAGLLSVAQSKYTDAKHAFESLVTADAHVSTAMTAAQSGCVGLTLEDSACQHLLDAYFEAVQTSASAYARTVIAFKDMAFCFKSHAPPLDGLTTYATTYETLETLWHKYDKLNNFDCEYSMHGSTANHVIANVYTCFFM